jgi:hypothetical protein
MHRFLPLLLLVAACGDGPSAAPDADLTVPPREIIEDTVALVPGELVEAVFHGTPDDFAIIQLSVPSSELDWNIHGHAGGDVQTIYEEYDVMTVDYRFTPSAEADWWLLLRNSGPIAFDVELRVELHGEMTWAWQ